MGPVKTAPQLHRALRYFLAWVEPVAVPDVVVVDHHDSYTWNLVHLVASSPVCCRPSSSTTRSPPTRSSPTATSCSRPARAPGRPGRLLRRPRGAAAGHAARCSASASACRGSSRRTAGRSGGSRPAHGDVAEVEHDGRGVFAGPAAAAARRPLPLARGAGRAPTPGGLGATVGDVVMGVRHRTLPLEGVQFHPESILSEHGAAPGRELPGGPMTDPAAVFADVAAAYPRCFWLDGGGAREWSGRRSLIGWLEPEDVSLTYDAAAPGGHPARRRPREVVGDDIFAVLEAELAAGSPSRPVVRLLRLRLPARPAGGDRVRICRTRSGCGRAPCGSSITDWSGIPCACRRFAKADKRMNPRFDRGFWPPPPTPPPSTRSRSSSTRATPTRST